MKALARQLFAAGFILTTSALSGASAQPKSAPMSPFLQGTWFLNQDLSDKPQNREGDDQGRRVGPGRAGGRGGGRGFGGRGGFGGGGFSGSARADGAESSARLRDAMRDILTPPDRLTIVQTDSMIIITTGDGRTIRLSPDGKRVKDENTGIERKTRWDAGKLVSEIDGLGAGKITESYSVDPDRNQLHVAVTLPNRRSSGEAQTMNRVYDAGDVNGRR